MKELEMQRFIDAASVRDELTLKVKSVETLTPTIKQFELVDAKGGKLPPFTAGAHVEVLTSNRLFRSYSLLNSQHESDRYVIPVKQIPGSVEGSQFMHDFVEPGDFLTVRSPRNSFPLEESAQKSVLIAGGIGITPLLSMARRLNAIGGAFILHYMAREAAEMAFRDEMEAEFGDRVVFHDTRHGEALPSIPELAPEFEVGTHLYLCGPAGLIAACRAAAVAWAPDNIHFELFINSAETRTEIAEPAVPFEVVLARSGTVLRVDERSTLLEVLIKHGVKVPCACKRGICGTCVVPLIAGSVDHRDAVLTPEERKNRLQTCVSRAMPGERLIIDR